MRDLRALLDEAAGNPPDLPDFARIREMGDAMKTRNRVAIGAATIAAALLVAAGAGAALQTLGDEDTTTLPAPQPSQSQSPTSAPVTNACPRLDAPARGSIAYTRTRPDDTRAVHVMAPDGTGDTCLADTPGSDGWPAWSDDGQWIAFIGGDGTRDDLFLVRADGSELTRVTESAEREVRPVWSPDGTRLAYTLSTGEDGPRSIHIIGRDGTGDTVVPISGAPFVELQDWSPDGATLLYGRDDSAGGQIALWVSAPDGTGQRLLRAEEGDLGSGASYSPDGTEIAFQADLDGGCIYRTDALASTLTRVTTGCTSGLSLSWSPDGRQLVTAAGDGGSRDAEVLNIDGTDRRAITTDGTVANVAWQPAAGG